jgi:hypothetical protein
MRNLSLDEKINIKGKLALKGVMPHVLVQLDMAAALRLHWACFGTPAATHSDSNPKLWRRRTPRAALMH